MILIPEIVRTVYPFGMDSGRINPIGTFQDRVGPLVISTRHLRGGAFYPEHHRQQTKDKQSRLFHNKSDL
ncbi:unknown [Parabacteroides johnsonii CAG:246]|nr:unknown [Parabacteroides johnsonii CAG:246]